MITYETTTIVKVKLDGKHVGDIKQKGDEGFFYQPKGSSFSGSLYPTIDAVKRSIEER